ncbi:Glycine betaine methyltransferase [subsurface metagenome]
MSIKTLKLLSDEELDNIHYASLEILERTGVDIYHDEALDLLSSSGAIIDRNRVKIPSHLVKRALSTVPERIVIADRLGKRKMFLEGVNVYFGTGSDLEYTLDWKTGERRLSKLQDIENSAKLCDCLRNIDFVMTNALASDIKSNTADIYQFYAMTKNTIKPLILTSFSTNTKIILEGIYEIACIIAESSENLKMNPFFIVYGQFVSPFKHDKMGLERLLFCAEKNLPIVYVPTILAGASGPATLAGSMAVGNAETLTGLVISQLKNPGAPFIYGGHVAPMDMLTTILPYGSPEWHMCSIVFSQLSRRYNLPSWSTGGCTDSKLIDGQALAEGVYSILLSALSGGNLIHDVGYLQYGLMGSLSYIVMLDEFIGLTRRILKGFQVNKETLALDLINEVGPGGSFLETQHTLDNFKKETWFPELFSRENNEDWKKKGSKSMKDRANSKLERVLESHDAEPIDTDKIKEIEKVIKKVENKARSDC